MKITVYCLKGSAGKTPIAVNIALDKGYAIGTNEPYNLLDTVISEESLMTVEPSEKFPDFGDEIDIVFDLAGMITHDAHNSIVSAIEQSDVVLVPIYNELKCLNAGVNTLRELQHHTKNIVVVATKLQKGSKEFFSDWRDSQDFKNIASVVENSVGQGIPIFPLKFSKVFDTIFEKEQSIGQLRASSGLEAYTYREPAKQFDDLFTYLEKHYAK
jgi:hypothetical protein